MSTLRESDGLDSDDESGLLLYVDVCPIFFFPNEIRCNRGFLDATVMRKFYTPLECTIHYDISELFSNQEDRLNKTCFGVRTVPIWVFFCNET